MWVHEDKYQKPTVKDEEQGTATDLFKACSGTFSCGQKLFCIFCNTENIFKKGGHKAIILNCFVQ